MVNHPTVKLDIEKISSVKYVDDYDEAATCSVFGFRTVGEYYRMGSSAQYVPDVHIPGLFFSALDDPIASSKAIPVREVLANPNLILATTKKGGHIGWFEGVFKPRRWFLKPVVEFVTAVLEVLFENISILYLASSFFKKKLKIKPN